jgi:hypothetical protein
MSAAVTIRRERAVVQETRARQHALDELRLRVRRERERDAGLAERRDQLERAGARRDALQRLLHHELEQLVHQRLALARTREHRFELVRGHRARGADQRPLVLDRERPPEAREQLLLGARPRLLGVEQQAIVVEHRCARPPHRPTSSLRSLVAVPRCRSHPYPSWDECPRRLRADDFTIVMHARPIGIARQRDGPNRDSSSP